MQCDDTHKIFPLNQPNKKETRDVEDDMKTQPRIEHTKTNLKPRSKDPEGCRNRNWELSARSERSCMMPKCVASAVESPRNSVVTRQPTSCDCSFLWKLEVSELAQNPSFLSRTDVDVHFLWKETAILFSFRTSRIDWENKIVFLPKRQRNYFLGQISKPGRRTMSKSN